MSFFSRFVSPSCLSCFLFGRTFVFLLSFPSFVHSSNHLPFVFVFPFVFSFIPSSFVLSSVISLLFSFLPLSFLSFLLRSFSLQITFLLACFLPFDFPFLHSCWSNVCVSEPEGTFNTPNKSPPSYLFCSPFLPSLAWSPEEYLTHTTTNLSPFYPYFSSFLLSFHSRRFSHQSTKRKQ